MKTVLLAIEGREPHRSAISFARQFCRKMHVALDILHVIGPGQDMPTGYDLQAEQEALEGERDSTGRSGAQLLTSENPPKAIANYIDTHRNIVLAIYDRQGGSRNLSREPRTGATFMGFEKPLAVPLVVMRA